MDHAGMETVLPGEDQARPSHAAIVKEWNVIK
jgi:hypothetical protein